MSQTNETKEQQEMKNGSPLIRTSMVTSPFPAPGTSGKAETPGTPGTSPGMLYPGISIIQNIYPQDDPLEDSLFTTKQMALLQAHDELMQLTTAELEKALSMVKDYSVIASKTGKMADIFQAALNLSGEQWFEILGKILDDELEPVDTPPDKLTVMITGTRDLSEKGFEKVKSRVMGHSAFKDGAAGRNLLDALYQVRSMTPGDFELLSVMVKLPSDKIPANAKQDLKKTCIQLRQLSIEQADVLLGMVKDSSIT